MSVSAQESAPAQYSPFDVDIYAYTYICIKTKWAYLDKTVKYLRNVIFTLKIFTILQKYTKYTMRAKIKKDIVAHQLHLILFALQKIVKILCVQIDHQKYH